MGRADIVIALVKSGLSYVEAGRRVGVTKGAVAGLVYRWRHPWVPKKRDWSVDRRADDWSVVLVEPWAERKARLAKERTVDIAAIRILPEPDHDVMEDPLDPEWRARVDRMAVHVVRLMDNGPPKKKLPMTAIEEEVLALHNAGHAVGDIDRIRERKNTESILTNLRYKGHLPRTPRRGRKRVAGE